jgi:hypothetical protein
MKKSPEPMTGRGEVGTETEKHQDIPVTTTPVPPSNASPVRLDDQIAALAGLFPDTFTADWFPDRLDHAAIHALAKRLKRPAGTLIVLHPVNDPFHITPARQARAKWFEGLWHRYFPLRVRIHLRAIHYLLVVQKLPVKMPSGMQHDIYVNTERCWGDLIVAVRDARLLGLVPIEAFEDHRNDAPMVFLPEGADEAAAATIDQPDRIDVDLEPLEPIESEPPALDPIDEVTILGLDYPGLLDMPASIDPPQQYETPEVDIPGPPVLTGSPPAIKRPYFHIEFWAEKTSVNDVLMSVARPYGVNVVTGSGFASLTYCHNLIERAIRSGKPVRIFYISDHDPSGSNMPFATARTIEFLLYQRGLDLDIQLIPIVLTEQQCTDYDLPKKPIKESDKGKASFEERYGEGAVELDALEALRPGELRRILIEAIAPYQDPDFDDRMAEAAGDLDARLEEIAADVVAEHQQELDELGDEYVGLIERRGAEADELGINRTSALNADIADLARDRIAAMNTTISGLRDRVTAINSEIRALVGPRVDAINAELAPIAEAAAALDAEIRARAEAEIVSINTDLAALDERFSEAIQEAAGNFTAKQQAVAAALEAAAEPVLDETEWPSPEEGETVEPLFDSTRGYLEQIDHYKKCANKPTTRKKGSGRKRADGEGEPWP